MAQRHLTRQHYREIARILRDNRNRERVSARLVVDDIASDLARYLGEDNPRFDRGKWFRAVEGRL